MSGSFRMLEHPSDIGLEVRGRRLEDVFEASARGLMQIIGIGGRVEEREERTLDLEATDLAQLLVRWLSEVLYQYDGERFLTAAATVTLTGTNRMHAVLRGEHYDPPRHSADLDVKAVTYHHLAVEQIADGWRAEVYLDI